jgi:putative tryptophan/tyrosine transport system substrate-binding protein
MAPDIGRREFISALGGGVVAWPLVARAQQGERLRRVGFQSNLTEGDREASLYVAAFEQTLAQLGWVVGRNVQIDYRWTAGNSAEIRRTAAELLALNPDVILTVGGSAVGPLQELSSTTPIVFVQTTDPVAAGFVDSLAHPGRNATGFTVFDWGIAAKWLALLKEIAPNITRVAVLRDISFSAGAAILASAQTAAPSLGVEVSAISLHDSAEIERGISAFAGGPNGGLIVAPSGLAIANRALIIALADRYRLPAIYPFPYFATDGGLIFYGPDVVEQYRQAATYINRILRDEKPTDLPVQNPNKYQLIINLKTAKSLGLAIPPTLIARADDVIE